MQTLDGTIVNTALPAMASDLGESPLQMHSVIVAYSLAMAVLIPASGWLADKFGTAFVGAIHGRLLTAWSVAGVVGPLVFAELKGIALYVAAALLIVGFLIALVYKRPEPKKA